MLILIINIYVKFDEESFKNGPVTLRSFFNPILNTRKYFYMNFLQFKDLFHYLAIKICSPLCKIEQGIV